ncbi:hypothetical protein ACFQU7_19825 [Pseudoroseomonas wenyumeiae]
MQPCRDMTDLANDTTPPVTGDAIRAAARRIAPISAGRRCCACRPRRWARPAAWC